MPAASKIVPDLKGSWVINCLRELWKLHDLLQRQRNVGIWRGTRKLCFCGVLNRAIAPLARRGTEDESLGT